MLARSLLLVCTLVQARALEGQAAGRGQIRGVVRDTSGLPLADVEVMGRTAGRKTLTNQRGQYSIAVISGGVEVIVARRVGFATDSLTVSGADTAEAILILRPLVVPLAKVDVTASVPVPAHLQGFEHRRSNKNGGQFITRDQIERRGSIATTDLLRRVPGIQIVDSMGVPIAISARGPKINMVGGKRVEACVVRVGVDGFIKDRTFGINAISPSNIHGIEVYAGAATIPPEFNSSGGRNAQCGLIMIWTR